MVKDTEPWCCYVGCPEQAEFVIDTINGGPDIYSDQTHACEEHVGHLLGTQPDAPNPERAYWEIRPIDCVSPVPAQGRRCSPEAPRLPPPAARGRR
jgi:hypothetical protein